MKLYDMHVHTRGISKCSRLSAEELCAALKEDGTDGFCLTNHYAARHVDLPFHDWLCKYRDEFYKTKEIAAGYGLGALFGIEVTDPERRDFLLYGVTPDCLFEEERPLWEFPLPELHAFAARHGALLFHAHPYRFNGVPADAADIDGIEINCHPLYLTSHEEDVRRYAEAHHLLLSCGSDYHGDIYKAHCGVWLPDDIQDATQLPAFFKKGQPALLVHTIDPERARATVIH
ncbi:MAG: PHP domain-containing protein [Clostridia bacterium]|nr:PHP domain-containing protein [Clostridia bacterium]